jgi:hypothetical protein
VGAGSCPQQHQHGHQLGRGEREADRLSPSDPGNDDCPCHVTGEDEGCRPRQEANDQEQATEQLGQADHDHEYLGRREPVGLERRKLRGVVHELASPEGDKHAAREQPEDQESSVPAHPPEPLREPSSSYAMPVAIA